MATFQERAGKWRVQVRRKGSTPLTRTFATRAQAESWAREQEEQIEQRPVRGLIPGPTVADFIQAYRELREAARPIADVSNEHYMLQHLSDGLGHHHADKLTPEIILSWAKARRKMGAGGYTLAMELSQLSTALKYAAAAEHRTLPDVVGQVRPLLKHLKLIGGGGKRKRRPAQDELERIVDILPQPYSDAVRFAVASCMRRGEITRIVWSDVDEAARLVWIRDRKDPREKQGNDQQVPLLEEAWAIVQAQPRDDERIFPIHPQTLTKYFTAACDTLGIPDLRLHDLRHHGISIMFEKGYSIEQVALVSGHRDWRNLARYTQLKPASLHDLPAPAPDPLPRRGADRDTRPHRARPRSVLRRRCTSADQGE